MAVASLPVARQAIQRQPQGAGTEVGKGLVRQEQESAVIDDQGQTATALLLAPADPAVAGAQPARGGAKDQHPEPVAPTIGEGIVRA